MVKGREYCERDVVVFPFVHVCVKIPKRQRCECVMIKEHCPICSRLSLCVVVRVGTVGVYLA